MNAVGTPRLTSPRGISASAKAKVRSILLANAKHYREELDQGVRIIGSTQYSDSFAGLAAFDDPNSAASRFRDYRKDSNPENDVSFLDAFKKADKFYNAQNEPDAIGTWRDQMSDVQ